MTRKPSKELKFGLQKKMDSMEVLQKHKNVEEMMAYEESSLSRHKPI